MITDKQNKMINMLIEGVPKLTIAKDLKISRQTIYDWMDKEEIKLEIGRRRQKMCEEALGQVKGDTNKLLAELEKMALTSENESIKVQCINSLLDRILGKATAKQEIELSNADNNIDVDLDSLLDNKDSNVIDLDKIAK